MYGEELYMDKNQYEKDVVRYQYAEYYYAAIAALCRDMLDEIKNSEAYRALKKTDDFSFFFRRWRGEVEKLESGYGPAWMFFIRIL